MRRVRAEEQIAETMCSNTLCIHQQHFLRPGPISFGMSNFEVLTHAALAPQQLMKPDANYTLHLK